jgi:DNA polymerase/3'-5' exonuclease PolX
MTDGRIPREKAVPVARALFAALSDTCEHIQIGGSLRRKAETVKDIELVAIPTAATYQVLDRMVHSGEAERADYGGTERWGKKYRGLVYRGIRCEVFFTDALSWGYQLWLRTGPGDANKYIMAQMQPSAVRCVDGAVWLASDWRRAGDEWQSSTRRQVVVSDEARMFSLLGMDWALPEARSIDLYARYMGTVRKPFTPPAAWLASRQTSQQLTMF